MANDPAKVAKTRRRRTSSGFFSSLTLKRRSSVESKYSTLIKEYRSGGGDSSFIKNTLSDLNPYNYPKRVHMVAQFHRDEIITGASLPLNNKFEFYDVCAIDTHHEPSDRTEGMTDFSGSNHEEQDALHHRQFPSRVAVGAHDGDEAREIIQAQCQTKTGVKAHKPLHKYMIKQVDPNCTNLNQAMVHLTHETNLWKKLSHKHYNLLTLRGVASGGLHVFGSQWDSYFLLTDRISETLGQRLQSWRDQTNPALQPSGFLKRKKTPKIPKAQINTASLSFRMKLVYAQNLANVLAFLHSRQIAVRNLSPDSIGFLASDDTLQLMDLGQAVEVNSSSSSARQPQQGNAAIMLEQQNEHALFQMTPRGQPFRYMAPELLNTIHHHCQDSPQHQSPQESLHYGTNVDSYSWAMICFEMLTLHQPFAKMKAGQHLRQIGLSTPSLRPHLEVYKLPPELERVLKSAWRQDATQRMEAAQIDKRLKRLLQHELHNSNHALVVVS